MLLSALTNTKENESIYRNVEAYTGEVENDKMLDLKCKCIAVFEYDFGRC